jgi:hypothetical protein
MRFAIGTLVVVSLFAALSGVGAVPLRPVMSAASADCKTAYRTVCVETDSSGKCKRFERESYEVCTGGNSPGSGTNVGQGSKDCYECTEYNNDGSCKKTRKVKC